MARVIESDCTATRQHAERLYGAYVANSGNRNYQGLPCPAWRDLPEAVRGHWCAVALFADSQETTS
jgi:hypothetical protein